MSYLDHIEACNNADLEKQSPFLVGGEQLGWLAPDAVENLTSNFRRFERTAEGVTLSDILDTPQGRSAAMANAAKKLSEAGNIRPLTGELYGACNRWGDDSRFLIDRAAVSYFGLRSYGVHVNGYVRKSDGLHLWIGKRSLTKPTYPGELDNTVAGGQPDHLTLEENMIKECGEEAGIDRPLAQTAIPVGCIAYFREEYSRIKPDCMYCYDLELPVDFEPVNTDGELECFYLMSADEVMRIVRETEDFKFNCNLALIDFFIRHGLIRPDTEPDYAALCHGLRQHGLSR